MGGFIFGPGKKDTGRRYQLLQQGMKLAMTLGFFRDSEKKILIVSTFE
jgi:hypothetical protein